jgi:hypothetical protein
VPNHVNELQIIIGKRIVKTFTRHWQRKIPQFADKKFYAGAICEGFLMSVVKRKGTDNLRDRMN